MISEMLSWIWSLLVDLGNNFYDWYFWKGYVYLLITNVVLIMTWAVTEPWYKREVLKDEKWKYRQDSGDYFEVAVVTSVLPFINALSLLFIFICVVFEAYCRGFFWEYLEDYLIYLPVAALLIVFFI